MAEKSFVGNSSHSGVGGKAEIVHPDELTNENEINLDQAEKAQNEESKKKTVWKRLKNSFKKTTKEKRKMFEKHKEKNKQPMKAVEDDFVPNFVFPDVQIGSQVLNMTWLGCTPRMLRRYLGIEITQEEIDELYKKYLKKEDETSEQFPSQDAKEGDNLSWKKIENAALSAWNESSVTHEMVASNEDIWFETNFGENETKAEIPDNNAGNTEVEDSEVNADALVDDVTEVLKMEKNPDLPAVDKMPGEQESLEKKKKKRKFSFKRLFGISKVNKLKQ